MRDDVDRDMVFHAWLKVSGLLGRLNAVVDYDCNPIPPAEIREAVAEISDMLDAGLHPEVAA